METQARERLSNKERIVIGIAILCIVAAVVGGVLWALAAIGKNDPRAAMSHFAQQRAIKLPLFYPKSLPDGFTLSEDSMLTAGDGLTFALVNGDKKIFVTQQSRPRLMEEVNKTQEFTTSVGGAYLAELNGRIAGFLIAPETLIIVNSPAQVDPSILRKLIEAMAPL